MISGCTQTGQFVADDTDTTSDCKIVQEEYIEWVIYQEQECTMVPCTDQECETDAIKTRKECKTVTKQRPETRFIEVERCD